MKKLFGGVSMRCPECGSVLDDDNFCRECCKYIDFPVDDDSQDDFGFGQEPDYDSMINNGDQICLNCTFWSVSPYGSSHGMICRKGNGQTEPGDSCFEFIQSRSFANYGDGGQFQFDETERDISNKLYHWRNSR